MGTKVTAPAVAETHVETRRLSAEGPLRGRIREGDVSLAAFILVAAHAIILALAANKVLEDTRRGFFETGPVHLLEELAGGYTSLVLLPAVVWLARRFPVRRAAWSNVAVLVLGLVPYSLVHTLLIALARAYAFPALGFPGHSFADGPVKHALIELSHDALAYPSVIALTMWWDARQRLAHAAQREADLAAALAQSQLHSLRLRLDPHFLFNTLNMIAATMHANAAAADEMLDLLSQFLRRGLERSDAQTASLAEELANNRLYLKLMQHRFGDALRVTVDVPPEIRNVELPTLTLQPLVENAIRHGALGTVGAGEIRIEARRVEDRLVLAIWSEGPLPKTPLRKGEGLTATARRLALLYGDRAALTIDDADGGTVVRVVVPAGHE